MVATWSCGSDELEGNNLAVVAEPAYRDLDSLREFAVELATAKQGRAGDSPCPDGVLSHLDYHSFNAARGSDLVVRIHMVPADAPAPKTSLLWWDPSTTSYSEATSLSPGEQRDIARGAILRTAALILEISGVEAAIPHLLRALDRFPDDPDLFFFVPAVVEAGAPELGLPLANAQLERNPDDTEALFWRAESNTRLAARGDQRDARLDAAIADYLRVVAEDPTNPEAELQLGNAYRMRGQLESARKHLVHYTKDNPTNPIGHYYLALTVRGTDIPAAIRHLERAEKLDPRDGDYPVTIAILQLEAGNKIAAAEAVERAAIIAPDDPRLPGLKSQLP
ncbi:MAG: tetratricopeptide repeat protein [Myxococcota bacterium]